jgi:hypothetical protein
MELNLVSSILFLFSTYVLINKKFYTFGTREKIKIYFFEIMPVGLKIFIYWYL